MSVGIIAVMVSGVDGRQDALRQVQSYGNRVLTGRDRDYERMELMSGNPKFWDDDEYRLTSDLIYDDLYPTEAAYDLTEGSETAEEGIDLIERKWDETVAQFEYNLAHVRRLLSKYRDREVMSNAENSRDFIAYASGEVMTEAYLYLEGYGPVMSPEEYRVGVTETDLNGTWVVPCVVRV